MFPTVRVSFSGPLRQVTPADRYVVLLDVVPVDNRRYRYAYHRSAWLVAGKADPPPPPRLYAHPDTPIGADALRKQVISFEKVKLTNNEMDKNGQVGSPCAQEEYSNLIRSYKSPEDFGVCESVRRVRCCSTSRTSARDRIRDKFGIIRSRCGAKHALRHDLHDFLSVKLFQPDLIPGREAARATLRPIRLTNPQRTDLLVRTVF